MSCSITVNTTIITQIHCEPSVFEKNRSLSVKDGVRKTEKGGEVKRYLKVIVHFLDCCTECQNVFLQVCLVRMVIEILNQWEVLQNKVLLEVML